MRHIVFDTNPWTSFVHALLAVPMDGPRCLSLVGRTSTTHRRGADHMLAEHRVRTEGRGRTVDEWKRSIESLNNHWLDGAVGACVAASMEGCSLTVLQTSTRERPPIRLGPT